MTEAMRKATTKGYIKRLHVDKSLVNSGKPALTVQTSSGSLKARVITINGPSTFVHRPDDPLSCGARLWIETDASLDGDFTTPQ